MAVRRLPVKLRRQDAMRVSRVALDNEKLVYVIVADKKLKYRHGRSKIAYIGTTKNGVSRLAQSAASRTDAILRRRGVQSFTVHVVTCRPRQRVKTWRKLERAFLLAFRELYGEVPACNVHGKRMTVRGEFVYFSKVRIENVIGDLS